MMVKIFNMYIITVKSYKISSIPLKQCLKRSLTQRLFMKVIKLKPKCTEMKENFLSIGHKSFQKVTSEMLSMLI